MKNFSVLLFLLAIYLIHSPAVLANLSDDEHRMCAGAGDMAEGVMHLRYSGLSSEEVNEYVSEVRESFRDFTGFSIEAMVSEAYQRPYRRSDAEQNLEAADFGRVYYDGCIRNREYQQRD